MTLRRSPEVVFIFDQSVAAQDRVEQILQELKQQEDARGSETDE
jgi:ribosome-binding factor A